MLINESIAQTIYYNMVTNIIRTNCILNKLKKLRRHVNEGTLALNIDIINGSDLFRNKSNWCMFISKFGICEDDGAFYHFQNILVF